MTPTSASAPTALAHMLSALPVNATHAVLRVITAPAPSPHLFAVFVTMCLFP